MAPEQIVSDLKSVGPATDVWALGVMLYEAICDELPFEADTFPELQARVVASEPKRPGTIVPGLSPELEAVCLKALAKDPSRRYVDGAALGSDLRRYLAGEPSLAGRRATGGTLRLLPLAAFAVALACVGLTLAILSKEDERPSGASDGTSSVTTVVMGTPAEEHGTVTSGPLKGPLRFLPELRAELLSPPLDVSEVNRLEAWRAMFAAGSWVELGRRLDPTRQSLLKFLAADAARDPGQYDRWALACLLNAWEQGDQRGLFYLGSWIVAKAKNSKSVQQGFDLIRHCASRPRSAPNLGWSADALYLSKVYTQQFQRGLEPNPKLAAAWLCIAQAGGLSRSGKHYREQVTVVRQVTKTLAKSTEQAWDWIAEEEQQLGRTPNPRLLEDGVLAVPSARERVARLASVNADADLAKLRELGKRSPLVYERLQEIERVGSPSALFRLSTLIVNDHPELSFRLCLRAAVAGKRAACRALRWHESCRTKPVADAWIELGSHGTPADRDRAWAVNAKWLASNPPGR
jgi:hypothetical protein